MRGSARGAASANAFQLELPLVGFDTEDLLGAFGEDDSEDEVEEAPTPLPDPFAEARETYGLSVAPKPTFSPRSYQTAAVDAWTREGGRGLIVLPTGAGKTVLALMAMAQAGIRTLVVVPTIELLEQWHKIIIERLQLPPEMVGMIGGGHREAKPVTVITYDSAAMPRRKLDQWGMLVFDEAHHLPARAYRRIAERSKAPLRLGLSATPERSDGLHQDLYHLIGPEIYRQGPKALARDKHIANYKERRKFVSLSGEEQAKYDALMGEYRWYIATHRSELLAGGGSGAGMFEALIRRSGFDPAARGALAAQRKARMLALNAGAKLRMVEELLEQHRKDKVIIFSEYNALVEEISRRLLIPSISYRTPAEERRETLAAFRSGAYTKLVTGRVLNEGVDVPDASVAIVVSGSSAPREYIQRLGRVLRPKPTEAVLYEIITRGTSEERSSRKRRPKEEVETIDDRRETIEKTDRPEQSAEAT